MKMSRLAMMVLVFFLLEALVGAQDADLNKRLEMVRTSSNVLTDYTLGPGDLLRVELLELSDINRDIQITKEGMITLPFVNEVKAEGKTTNELERALEKLFADAIIQNPHVSVMIKERRSQPVNVLGEVTKPGTYQISKSMNLADVLSLAGGLTEKAGDICTINRMGNDGKSEKITINIYEMLFDGKVEYNIPISTGDILNVAKKRDVVFHVLGEVNKPGSYNIEKNQILHLSQAISMAGGYTKIAKLDKVNLVRDVNNKKEVTVCNMKEILRGKGTDVEVKENDLIFIPGSGIKSLANNMQGGLTSLIAAGLLKF